MKFAGKVWKLLVGRQGRARPDLHAALLRRCSTPRFRPAPTTTAPAAARCGSTSPARSSSSRRRRPRSMRSAALGDPRISARRGDRTRSTPRPADDRIKAVALDLDLLTGGGQSAIANVGEALDRVRRAGKRVVAYATGYSDDGYQLAAHADEVWLDPLGAVLIAGPGGANLYYAGLLERLGITANVYRVGTYKSAVEPYTRNDMSPEAREASQALADALWETWRQDVGRARPRAQIAAYVADPQRFIQARERRHGAGGAECRPGRPDRRPHRLRPAHGRARRRPGDDDVPGSYRAVHYEAWADDHPAERSRRPDRRADRRRRDRRRPWRGRAPPAARRSPAISSDGLRERRSQGAGRAGRFAGRIGARLGADPPRHPRRQGARPPGGRLDGLGRGLGRLLDRDRRRHHLRRAFDDHRLDRRVRHPAELRRHAAAARRRRRRRADDAAFGRARSAARPLARGGPAAADGRRDDLSPLRRAWSPGRGTCRRRGSTRSRQGRVWDGGTARQLGLVDRFGSLDDAVAEAARRANLDPADARTVYLEKEPDFWSQLFATMCSAAAMPGRKRPATPSPASPGGPKR